MADEDDLIVEVPEAEADETPEVKVEANGTEKEIAPEEGIAELKAKVADHQRRVADEVRLRQEAEASARDAQQAVTRVQAEKSQSDIAAVTNALAREKSTRQALRTALMAANEGGDFTKITDLQLELADNASAIAQLERGKTALEARKDEPQQRQQQQPARQQQQSPLETFASRLPPKSAQWARSKLTEAQAADRKFLSRLSAAHFEAEADDIQQDTPEYFAHIEKRLGMNGTFETTKTAETPPVRPQSQPAAAPVSRQAVTNGGAKPNVVRLSREQREIAEMSFDTDPKTGKPMTNEEKHRAYARHLLALRKDNRVSAA